MCTIMPRKAAMRWWGIDVPKNIIYYYHNEGYHFPGVKPNWKIFTIQDLTKKKVEKQNNNLHRKRAYCRIVPCYICVHKFSDDGMWYILIQTVKFNQYVYKDLKQKIIQKYNCGVFPEMTELWFEAFFRLYKCKPTKSMLKRAVMFTKCIIDKYNNLIDVL